MALVKLTKINDSILCLRGQQAVKRNSERFPEDFGFQLSEIEKEEVVTNCDHLQLKINHG